MMLSSFKIGPLLLAVAALSSEAVAHYRFTTLYTTGTGWTAPFQYVRPSNIIPVSNLTSTDMRCGLGSPVGTSTGTAPVPAGDTVGFRIGDERWVNYPGVLNVYMGQAPASQTSASQWDGSGAQWFKIYQISDGGATWPTSDKTEFLFEIPAQTPNGEYLLRIEHIALHAAAIVGGVQFHTSCAQIKVLNGGSGNPSKVSIPGVYTETDPGLRVNLFNGVTNYVQPGPPVWSGV